MSQRFAFLRQLRLVDHTYVVYVRRVRRFHWRVMIVQNRWRVDWRTPRWLPVQFVVTLQRWL